MKRKKKDIKELENWADFFNEFMKTWFLFLVTDQTAGALGFERPSFQYSISEDPVQKDNILLNYCIDDIERFCAELKLHKLQGVEYRQSQRHNEPRAIDFVNIFQKFKLAFNLLVIT